MPTFNQLVKQGRKKSTYKSNSPAMQKGLASAPPSELRPPRSPTPRSVRSPVCV